MAHASLYRVDVFRARAVSPGAFVFSAPVDPGLLAPPLAPPLAPLVSACQRSRKVARAFTFGMPSTSATKWRRAPVRTQGRVLCGFLKILLLPKILETRHTPNAFQKSTLVVRTNKCADFLMGPVLCTLCDRDLDNRHWVFQIFPTLLARSTSLEMVLDLTCYTILTLNDEQRSRFFFFCF